MWRMCLAVCLLAGCGGDERPPMCTTVDLTCAPGFVPTFTNVYKNVLGTSTCGSTNGACHSTNNPQGGLSFATQQMAFDGLMATSELDGPRKRVTPGDPACSLMIVRITGVGHDYQMPPGNPLSPEQQCALEQWVQMGAQP